MFDPTHRRHLLAAQITTGLFAGIYTLWSLGLLVLMVSSVHGPSRSERLGFVLVTGSAAVCLRVVYCLIRRSRVSNSNPRR